MKKIITVLLLAGFVLINGCGGDDGDGNGTGSGNVPTVRANTSVNAPTLSGPNESVWNSVTGTEIAVSMQNTPKLGIPKETAATSVTVQAINKNGNLYLRLKWVDADFSVWRDYFKVSQVGPPVNFVFQGGEFSGNHEDQIYVMFNGAPGGGWDIWNWRVLTTGTGELAEGFRYNNAVLTRDAGTVPVATPNGPAFGGQNPLYVHTRYSNFKGYLLDLDSLSNNYSSSTGWVVGDTVPGWIIDRTVKDRPAVDRNSRFDIRAVSEYSQGQYTLVLCRALNTGYTSDDLDMSSLTSVTAKIGILNNKYDLNKSGSGRLFTKEFNLILK